LELDRCRALDRPSLHIAQTSPLGPKLPARPQKHLVLFLPRPRAQLFTAPAYAATTSAPPVHSIRRCLRLISGLRPSDLLSRMQTFGHRQVRSQWNSDLWAHHRLSRGHAGTHNEEDYRYRRIFAGIYLPPPPPPTAPGPPDGGKTTHGPDQC